MIQGTGPTVNKFTKVIVSSKGSESHCLEIGFAPHQFTLEALKGGAAVPHFTADEVAEAVKLYEAEPEEEEEEGAPSPDAKRRPSGSRKADREADPAAEIPDGE